MVHNEDPALGTACLTHYYSCKRQHHFRSETRGMYLRTNLPSIKPPLYTRQQCRKQPLLITTLRAYWFIAAAARKRLPMAIVS